MTLPAALALVGEDEWERRECLRAALSELGLSRGDPDFEMHSARELTPEMLRNALETFPFLAPKRLIWVEDAQILRGEWASVVKTSAGPNASLILNFKVPVQKAERLGEWTEIAQVKKFWPLSEEELCRWLSARARFYGKQLSPRAAGALVSSAGADRVVLDSELAKLAEFCEEAEISERAVWASAGFPPEAPPYKLADAFWQGRGHQALEILERQLEMGKNPALLLAELSRAAARALRPQTATWPAQRAAAELALRARGRSGLQKILSELAAEEEKLKTGRAEPEELVLVQLIARSALS